MTPSRGQTMITLAGSVHWQSRAGVTQQALAVLLILFYVSPQTAMNVAIQRSEEQEGCVLYGPASV